VPLVDLPLDELERYQGRNPRPDDFDEYWERALLELDDSPAMVSVEPATFVAKSADAYDLSFAGADGADLYAKLVVPKEATSAPAVVMFHGYSGNSGEWLDLLSWASEGFVVAALDVRGQGGRSGDPGGYPGTTYYGQIIRGAIGGPDSLLYRSIYLDCAPREGRRGPSRG
jgi:cephalosporin-C deacetylase